MPAPVSKHRPAADNNDADKVRAAQRGDRQAMAWLIDRYWDRLYRWLYHMTHDVHMTEDLVQETFCRAMAALHTFRAGSNFRAWLFRIGYNNFINWKRASRHAAAPLSEDGLAGCGPASEQTVEDREWLEAVARAVAQLPLDFRLPLLLRAYEGLSFRELAKIIGTTEDTARWRVFKARQMLVRRLRPEPPTTGQPPAEESKR